MDRCPASVTRNLHQQRLPSRRCPASLLIVKNGLIEMSLNQHRLYGRFQFTIGVVVEKRNAK